MFPSLESKCRFSQLSRNAFSTTFAVAYQNLGMIARIASPSVGGVIHLLLARDEVPVALSGTQEDAARRRGRVREKIPPR
jgi:hypothetical protein